MSLRNFSIRHRLKRLIVILLSLIVLTIIYFGFQYFFRVQSIEVIGNSLELQIDQGRLLKNLLFLSTDKLNAELKKAYPLLEKIIVKKKFPRTLVIEASKRQPIARLTIEGHRYFLDKEGVLLEENITKETLPEITIFSAVIYQAGNKINDQKIKQSLSFIDLTGDIFIITGISEFDSSSLRAKVGKTEILFPQEGNLSSQITTLQTLFNGFRIKGILPITIDLRYIKPSIIF